MLEARHLHVAKSIPQVIFIQNETTVNYKDYACLHQLVEKQVKYTPDTIAVVFEDVQITYQELNQSANLLAHCLDAAGVGPDILVGVCMERSIELVVALLAILKAGGAYVPLDPGYPHDRLAYMTADAQVSLVLTQTWVQERISLRDVQTRALDAFGLETTSATDRKNLDKAIQLDNLAYMIYTSGSTGNPKGAMNRHRSIHNRLAWMQEKYQLTSQDRVLQKTPFSFDVSVWEFFWPLMTGACLVMSPPEAHKDPAVIKTLLLEHAITTLHFVPAMLQSFLQEPALAQIQHVRRVICSGEALSVDLQTQFFSQFSALVQLHNLYGPTEAAIDVSFWECQRNSPEERSVPIGRPIANTQLYILDTDLEPTPLGVAGELHIGGVNLARGYYQRPELTAERFIPDPFSQKAGAQLYKTGDQAIARPDGALEYLGRLDHQVKLRGFRIELGEIESALQRQPGILQALVIVREDTPGDKRLVAYLLLHGEAVDNELLRAALKETLPEYMIPAAFVFLQSFPLSPSGKIDRGALPAPDAFSLRQDHPLIAPRNPLEAELVSIWTTVLHIDQVSVTDNFFELGGHSLLATQVIGRVRQILQADISLPVFFQLPTIEALACYVQEQRQFPLPVTTLLGAVGRVDALPASFAQQRLWFLQQLDPGSTAYNLPIAFRLEGPLVLKALLHSLTALIQRHEVLRTTFASRDGQAIQVIEPWSELTVPLIELTGMRERVQEA